MTKTLAMVAEFRKRDAETPIVLMGYYNPIYVYGNERFLADAVAAGVDGLIVVDVPPEADDELCLPAIAAGLNFIRLATPTTDDKRLPAVLNNTSGFLYYVSITGITGAAAPEVSDVRAQIERIKRSTSLPVAVGFGVRTPEQARALATAADAVVVGSAIVTEIAKNLDDQGRAYGRTSRASDDRAQWRGICRQGVDGLARTTTGDETDNVGLGRAGPTKRSRLAGTGPAARSLNAWQTGSTTLSGRKSAAS